MIKKLAVFLICLSVLLTAVGCGKNEEVIVPDDTPSEVGDTTNYKLNPLTGLEDVSKDKVDDRPVAIMVNNLNKAQAVQTGLTKADVVYETEVEGGITRLLAVYQDVSKVERIGSVRSARYAYIDLAMGHNAFYVHHGQDPVYAKPHLADAEDYQLSTNNGGARIKNGLSSEHTLYAYGDSLWSNIVNSGRKTENTSTDTWLNFEEEGKEVKLENTANSVTVPFSSSYRSSFVYDSSTGKYIRHFNGKANKDSLSGENLYFKNVFVLLTSISTYPDGEHEYVSLSSGKGYYLANGTYTEINWSKGGASNSFVFTDKNGKELTVNAGNSWVCLADSSTSQPKFE